MITYTPFFLRSDTNVRFVDLEMIAKYGEGTIQEKKCPKCEYKGEIQTAGVNLLGCGCIKVYSSDDDFHCPQCGFTEEG